MTRSFKLKKKKLVYVGISVQPVFDIDGELRFWLGNEDITDALRAGLHREEWETLVSESTPKTSAIDPMTLAKNYDVDFGDDEAV
jgi:hypothetical protein